MIELILLCLLAALLGLLISIVISLIPGLHIYNVIAITMLIVFSAYWLFDVCPGIVITSFMVGMVVSFSVLFTVSSNFFQPADESYRFIILPHEKYLLDGRGYEAVLIVGLGSLIAILFISITFPIFGTYISALRNLLIPNMFWILGAIILFILMSEWPKDFGIAKTKKERIMDGWIPILMGYLSFILAGLLGIFIFYKNIIPVESSFQSLMPVFIGLFAIPSQICALIANVEIPKQNVCKSVDIEFHDVFRGGVCGVVAGFFASITPSLTPGPSLLVTGHATAQGGDKQFMLAGGAARVMYYVGAILLFFLPDVYVRKGGAAINISLFFLPETLAEFFLIGGIIAIVGFLSFIILIYFSRLCIYLVSKVPYKLFSLVGMVVLITLVAYVTSWQGIIIMVVASLIGLIPVFWHTRRISLLSVLLVPIFLNMAGLGDVVANVFGLI
ncbi:MAG: tripartite tricarboxylate transporter permease [Candidatus Thermoplasmatota archaeon]